MKKKTVLLVFSSIFLILLITLLRGHISLYNKSAYLDSYEMFCPVNCPNSLWVCTEGELYFASDKNGRTLGAARMDGAVAYYGISFDWKTRGFDVWKLENIAYPHIEYHASRFGGAASFAKDSCRLTYYDVNDRERLFGTHKGKVKLTFVRTSLGAPFSFDGEASLNELPFR